MISLIDCNLRIGVRGKAPADEPCAPAELIAEMDRLSIAGGLVRHQEAIESGPRDANERVFQELKGFEERLWPTVCLLPDATEEMGPADVTVEEAIEQGARAAWLYPRSHGYVLRAWCAGSMLDALAERCVPTFMKWDEVNVDELADALATHPELPIVLCNVNYRTNRMIFPLLEAYPQLHLDLGAPHSLCGFIEDVVGRFGPERLLFGSGFPDQEMGPAIAYLLYADIPDDDKERIGGENLLALLEGVAS
jgi:hypothetical protein